MKTRKTLVRLHKWQVDEKRKRLSDLLSLKEGFLSKLKMVEEAIIREQKFVNSAVRSSEDAGFSYGAFAQAAILQRQNILRSIEVLGAQITEAELAVSEAFKSLKRQEIALANHELQQTRTREKREQKASDEQAIESHMRKSVRG